MTATFLRGMQEQMLEAKRADVPQYKVIYNAGLFMTLIEQDISAYSEAITFARSEWQRQFFARGLAVLLFEAAEDMPQVFGKSYREALGLFENGQEWLLRLNPIMSEFNRFKVNRSTFLGEVRNLVSAHREHDSSAQLALMDRLKSIELYGLSAEFSAPLRKLADFYLELIPYMRSIEVTVKQVLKAMVASGDVPPSYAHDA